MTDLPILYDFTAYESPKRGVFAVEANVYDLGGVGWVQKEEVHQIIGETEDSYVYRLYESGHGEWVGDVVVEYRYIMPLGIHKSRLRRWLPFGQLPLFNHVVVQKELSK